MPLTGTRSSSRAIHSRAPEAADARRQLRADEGCYTAKEKDEEREEHGDDGDEVVLWCHLRAVMLQGRLFSKPAVLTTYENLMLGA